MNIINPYRFASGATPPAPLHWWDLTDLKLGLWDYGSGEFGKLATSSAGVTVETDQPDGAGDCIEFDNSGATDGYVTTLTDQAWDGAGNDISISCWIAFPTGSNYINSPFFSWYNSSPDDRLVLLEVDFSSEAWSAIFYDTGTNTVEATDTNEDPVADGTWYHVVATYNGTTDTASLYVDDTFIDSTTNASMGALETTAMPLAIGARADLPISEGIDARMFSLSIYDKVLDADERSALYNSGNGGTYADFFGSTPAIGTNPTTTNLVGWWELEDATDSHTGGYDMTENGTMTYTSGYNANAGTFDGSTDYLSILDSAITMPTGAMTVAAWVKISSFTNFNSVMTQWQNPSNRSLLFAVATDQTVSFNVSGDGTESIITTTTDTIPIDTWVHICGVYVPSTSVTIYINGAQSVQNTTSIPASLFNSTAEFQIGSADSVGANTYAGQIDDAVMYDTDLSADEVKWLVANTFADL